MKITATGMTTPASPHTARTGDGRHWQCTWLPGRRLSRNEAITAMSIAELAASDPGLGPGGPLWPHVEGWAAELRLSATAAISRLTSMSGKPLDGTPPEVPVLIPDE